MCASYTEEWREAEEEEARQREGRRRKERRKERGEGEEGRIDSLAVVYTFMAGGSLHSIV